ncbi:MAG: adenylate/guanylate cyclase domain-containing protein [Inquilinus sp.]|nr:adenylate/guanylate cyclase domain-containing protein [Inquilinus sp.]
MERRLAAILSADVVGYSRLIRADEEGTLAAFKDLLSEFVDPKIAGHSGRIVKLMGDGILAEFGSAVEAVRAACEMQQHLGERNAGLSDSGRIELRMGINLGDVVIDGDDIHGDGVNVASRLEKLSKPGGICISGKVYEEVRDRTDLAFEDLGDRDVKNIDRPVRVYRLKLGAVAKPHRGARRPPRGARRGLRGPWPIGLGIATAIVLAIAILTALPSDVPTIGSPAVPTVAVVPFESIGSGPRQAELVAGLIEDLRITLSEETGLRVVSREIAAGTDGAGDRPGARDVLYVIDGSVRQSDGRMRITASLISAGSGVHLWGGRYDRDASDMLTVQEEVAGKIVASLAVKLSDEETERLAGDEPTSVLWAGLAELGRLAERTLSFSMDLFGRDADARSVVQADAGPASDREADGR